MIERSMLEEGHVELVRHQRASDVRSEIRMAVDRRKITRAGTFIRDVPLGSHTQRECRVMVEEKRRDMIVVDHEQHVRTLVGEPRAERREVFEDWRPHGVVALVAVVRKADGRRVGGGNAANDSGHGRTSR
jgi:hypothetical protein